MGFIETLILSFLLAVAAELLRPKQTYPAPKPGDIEPPNAEEGGAIPVVWGTCKVSPAVVWFGDTFNKRIEKELKTGYFSKTRVTVGYEYGAGMMLAICHGKVDQIQDIYFNDYLISKCPLPYTEGEGGIYDFHIPGSAAEWDEEKKRWVQIPAVKPALPLNYAEQPLRLQINGNSLYGGPDLEGGVWGEMDIHFGSREQGPNAYLAKFFGADRTSHYRGLCYAVARRMVLGRSNYIKPMWFVVKRCPDTLGHAASADIDGDANVAHIVYEILTNATWGLGMPESEIDKASFLAVAQTLKTEGRGVSFIMKEQPSSEDAIREVLRHVDGVLFPHPLSGKMTLKLIRADYAVASLPRVNPQNASDLVFTRGSWRETINEIKLDFTNRAENFKTQTVQAQNLASIQAMGEVVSRKDKFMGFTTPANAQWMAEKLLKAGSLSLSRASFKANRSLATLTPGACFVLDWPPYGISGLVMRVTRPNYGSLLDGEMEVDAVEDLFGYTGQVYGTAAAKELPPICGA